MDGKMSLGQLITYNTLLVYFTNPLENIINLQTKLQTAQVANNRLNEVYLVASEFEEKKTVEDLMLDEGRDDLQAGFLQVWLWSRRLVGYQFDYSSRL